MPMYHESQLQQLSEENPAFGILSPHQMKKLLQTVRKAISAIDRDRDMALTYLRQVDTLLAPRNKAKRLKVPCGTLAPWQECKAKEFIEEHLGQPILVSDIASEVRLSSGYFSRAFKRSFGRTPQAYIQERRVLQAQTFMLESEESLAQIALICGFSDQSHFCRVFHKYARQSPWQWRRQHESMKITQHEETSWQS